MEVTKDRLYFFIEGLRRNGFNAQQIHDMIIVAFPQNGLSVSRIRALCQEFREGRDSAMRMEGSGRNKSETRLENIEEVTRLIQENPSISQKQIGTALGIHSSMVQRILQEDVDVMWVNTKWVPHTLSVQNKAVRVERCQELIQVMQSRLTKANLVTVDEKFFYLRNLKPKNTIGAWVQPFGDVEQIQTAKRSSMERKYLVIMAVSQKGVHYYEILPINQSINAERYILFIENMTAFFQNQNQDQRILPHNMRLQQDNARPHVAQATLQYFEDQNIRLLRQPPYSPDVNLCDRFIFPRLEALREDFETQDDISEFLNQQLPHFTQNRMGRALNKMIEHMQNVILNDGCYL